MMVSRRKNRIRRRTVKTVVRKRICYLIEETTKARGVFDTPTIQEHKRYCEELSVTRTEYYDADNVGLKPEVVLKLSRAGEYNNEITVRYEGKVYDIIRNYPTRDGGIELVIQRSDIHDGQSDGNNTGGNTGNNTGS